jgi:glycogen(starch) synthase
MTRVLILSWEYPPLIEGGLARHVRKLAENLVAQGIDVHVLARGSEDSPAEEELDGVMVHRVREPARPRDLGEFVTWVEHMNADMLAAGVELGDRFDSTCTATTGSCRRRRPPHKRFGRRSPSRSMRPSTGATRAG